MVTNDPIIQSPNITYVVVQLRSCCDDMVTTFKFNNTPLHFISGSVYIYAGATTFANNDGTFLEPGKCYTATVEPSDPGTTYLTGPPISDIPIIESGCANPTCVQGCEPPPCGCPPGYFATAEGICQKVTIVNPSCTQPTHSVIKGSVLCSDNNQIGYGYAGAVFYDNVTNLPWPILSSGGSYTTPTVLADVTATPVPVVANIQNNVWGKPTGTLTDCANYRLNKIGVDAGSPPSAINEWVGLVFYQNLSVIKTYYIGIAADDAYKIFVNGNLIVDTSTSGFNFSSWKIIPITLYPGPNVIEGRFINTGGPGTLGFEVYDATLAQLLAVTTANGTPGPTDLNQYIVYSAFNLIGNASFQTGEVTACNCPDGYTFNPQNRTCLQILTATPVICNLQLTPCCGSLSPIIIDSSRIPLVYVGFTACIQDIDPSVGCWIISTTDQPINYTGPLTVGSYSFTCEKCIELGCKNCTNAFFTINDCCTNEPLKVNDIYTGGEQIIYLQWDGSTNIEYPSPDTIGVNGITQICNETSGCHTVCAKLIEVSEPAPGPNVSVVSWFTVMQQVTTVPTCEDCKECHICYLLTNCQNSEDTIVTDTDLSNYINDVVSIEGCKDKCYIVTLAENCDNCSQAVTVVAFYEPLPSDTSVCTYIIGSDSLDSLSITIDGTVYDFTNPATFIEEANALNLGLFGQGLFEESIPTINVTGNHEYGQLCINYTVGGSDCLNATCSIVNKLCSYQMVSPDGFENISVIIDGTTYTSPSPILFSNIEEILNFLNSLDLGLWMISGETIEYQLSVSGNHDYGVIIFGQIQLPTFVFNPSCEAFTSSLTACQLCLPTPPEVKPLLLKTRSVSPGYRTPGCSPEYTEKVNMNFSEQVYAEMLSVRYGLTACCEEDLEYWAIKKQLLDFKTINDNNLTDYNNV